jgi:uncharacterized protein (DUF1697 family)
MAAAYICFLRGVNVGGNKLLKMDALRELCGSIGLSDAKTYLQSGNIVFRSNARPDLLIRKIEDAIRKATGFESKVILRTTDELRDAIAANPFVGEREGNRMLVAFLDGKIGDEAKAALLKLKTDSEELRFTDRELYLYFHAGMADSKLASALTPKKLGVNVTARNWNTVNALVKMGEALSG